MRLLVVVVFFSCMCFDVCRLLYDVCYLVGVRRCVLVVCLVFVVVSCFLVVGCCSLFAVVERSLLVVCCCFGMV